MPVALEVGAMPKCRNCSGEFDASELVRHERDGLVVVHCPDCEFAMGSYNSHGSRPRQ
jgi:uncharacterized Zn finger protein